MCISRRCYLIIVLLSLISLQLTAQYGIGTNNPNPSAALDIVSGDRGILIPRVSLTSSSTFAPIFGTADHTHNGMLVYNTATTTLYGEGFYYWDWDKNRGSGLWRRFSTNGEISEIPYLIQDEDEDTHVAVDKNPGTDTDEISFTVSGAEQFKMVGGNRLEQSGDGGILIGKTKVDGSSIVFIGNRAGGGTSKNAYCTGIGANALASNSSIGVKNTAVGYNTLKNNITGDANVAVGYNALASNKSGFRNTAVGYDALVSNEGNANVAVGYNALYNNKTGYDNVAVGYDALASNEMGNANVAAGYGTLTNNQTGFRNTAVGHNALYSNKTGDRNTAVAYNALYNNKTGYDNVAVGHGALLNNESGILNIGIGNHSGLGIVNGIKNVIIGNDVKGLPMKLSNTVIIADGGGNRRIVVDPSGNVGINSSSLTHSYTLTVSGSIGMEVNSRTPHPDYVFESYYGGVSEYNKDYKLMTLEEVESFVKANKHLPGVQSRADIERNNGWNVSENVRVNLEKIEELYLHAIEQEKQIKTQKQELKIQQQLIEELSLRLEKLKSDTDSP